MASPGVCPFCNFTDPDSYVLLLHVETLHSEGESPFIVRDEEPEEKKAVTEETYRVGGCDGPDTKMEDTSEEDGYATCPETHCGEVIPFSELSTHLDMHVAEKINVEHVEHFGYDDARNKKKLKTSHRSSGTRHKAKRRRAVDGGSSSASSSSRQSTIAGSITSTSAGGGWRRFLLGTRSPKHSQQSLCIDNGGPRRLGVRSSVGLRFTGIHTAHILKRKQNSGRMRTKSKCPDGYENSSRATEP